jgi:hypothetical protein
VNEAGRGASRGTAAPGEWQAGADATTAVHDLKSEHPTEALLSADNSRAVHQKGALRAAWHVVER